MMLQEDDAGMSEVISGIPLEVLLSSPLCWKPSKICSFLLRYPDCLENKSVDDPFLTELNEAATALGIWPSGGSWKDILGQAHFDILHQTCKEGEESNSKKRKVDEMPYKSCVAELMEFIKNKYQHSHVFTIDEKKQLGWYLEYTEDSKRDDLLFSKYWTRKYPHLLPLLWTKFKIFREILSDFYPDHLDALYANDLWFDLSTFHSQLYAACAAHLDQGWVAERYMVLSNIALDEERNASLELRILPGSLITSILDNSPYVELTVTQENISFKWDNKPEHVMEYQEPYGSSWKIWETGTFIITDASEQIDPAWALAKFSINSSPIKRIVIFTSSETVQSIAKIFEQHDNFVANPVRYGEVNKATREMLMDEGYVEIPSGEYSLASILPENEGTRDSLLSKLNGKVLNTLLRGESPKILSKHQLPSLSENYIERCIVSREKFSYNLFLKDWESDIFLVLGMTLESLLDTVFEITERPNDLGERFFEIGNLADFLKPEHRNRNSGTFAIRNDSDTINEFMKNLHGMRSRVHLLRYSHKLYAFSWIAANGEFKNVQEPMLKFNNQIHKEDEFLRCLEQGWIQEERIMVISDKAAMGKSQLLTSLAYQLSNSDGKIVLSLQMTEFIQIIQNRISGITNVSKNIIISAITELICVDEFEKSLVVHWLSETSVENLKAKFEIIFDGIDEVKVELKELSFAILEIIKNELLAVRVWIGLREYMLEDIINMFGCIGFKLTELSECDQKDLLKRHWCGYWRKCNPGLEFNLDLLDLDRFAEKCIKIPISGGSIEMASIPLLCQMIAEIYEETIIGEKTNVDTSVINSVAAIYEKLLQRKVQASAEIENPVFSTELERAHIYFALKLCLPENVANKFLSKFLEDLNEIEKFEALVIELGIVVNISPLTFVHKTFAEYFVALFCFNVVTGKYSNMNASAKTFHHFVWNEILSFSVSLDAMGYVKCSYKNPVLFQFFNSMWEERGTRKLVEPERMHIVVRAMSRCFDDKIRVGNIPELKAILDRLVSANEINEMESEFGKSEMSNLFIAMLKCKLFDIAKDLIENEECFHPSNWNDLHDDNGKGVLNLVVSSPRFCRSEWPSHSKVKEFIDYIYDSAISTGVALGSLVEQKDSQGRTPLLTLIQCVHDNNRGTEYIDLLSYFVEKMKPNVNATDRYGNTVLHASLLFESQDKYMLFHMKKLIECYIQSLELFIRYGFNGINAENVDGNTPLLTVIHYFNGLPEILDVIKALHKYGADFNERNYAGNSALHIAVEGDFWFIGDKVIAEEIRRKLITELIELGADISTVNEKGQCALHLAVEKERFGVVKLLLEKEPECLHEVDRERKTVLQYETSDEIRDLLNTLSVK